MKNYFSVIVSTTCMYNQTNKALCFGDKLNQHACVELEIHTNSILSFFLTLVYSNACKLARELTHTHSHT